MDVDRIAEVVSEYVVIQGDIALTLERRFDRILPEGIPVDLVNVVAPGARSTSLHTKLRGSHSVLCLEGQNKISSPL